MSPPKTPFSLFGKKKATDGPSVEEQCQQRAEHLGRQIEQLQEKLDHGDEQIRKLQNEARACAKTNKRKALNAVRRIKQMEKSQDQANAIINNLQTQLDQIQQAAMNISAIKAVEDTTVTLKSILESAGLDENRIDEIQDEAVEMAQKLDDLARSAATPIGDQPDNDELQDELNALVAGGEVEEPVRLTAPAGRAPGIADEEGLGDLMAAFT
jgi:DNA repair exonuclease SbcCD ATPase subunit